MLGWFRKRKSAKVSNYTFTDDDRETAEISRLARQVEKSRLQLQKDRLKRLQQRQQEIEIEEQIADLEEQLYGSDEEEEQTATTDTPDMLIMQLLTKAMNKTSQPQQPIVAQKQNLSETQLRAIKERIPSHQLKVLKKASDEEAIEMISQNYPDFINSVDDETVAKALLILRE